MIRKPMATFGRPRVISKQGCFATFIAVLSLLMTGCAFRAMAQSQSGFTYNGIVYTSYQASEYLETPQGPQGAAAIRATGANYVSVLATQYVQTYTSNTIALETASTPGYNSSADPLSPTDAAVVAAIQNLQAQGLSVVLKPQVDSIDGVYRGSFAPTSPAAWFASYQTFILHYAQLASENNVGTLIIGTELKSLSGSAYETYWDNIIAQIRSSYPSLTLIYGANATGAGDEFTTVSFWDKVDIIGVDGYFPLTNQANPTVAQLVAAWTNNKNGFNAVAALQALQSQYGKPLIFTELGYVSAAGTNEAPYNSAAAGAAYDPTEQQDCYEAFFQVFSQQTAWMKGVFWWAWTVSPPGADDTGYTPQNKPAGTAVLPEWFGSTTSGFTLTPASSQLTLGEGLNTTDVISVTDLGGFTGAVTLTATGLPSGVSASFAAGTASGTQVLTLTATDGAAIGTATVTIAGSSGSAAASVPFALTVQAPLTQSITFNNPGPQAVGTPLTLSASATSGSPVTFASSTPGVCTVNSGNGTASFLTSGTCDIAASQGGNSIYSAATPVTDSFNVGTLAAVPVPAAADVLVSQVNWLDALNGYVQTSNNPTGGSFGVNTTGGIAVADTDNLILVNAATGAALTLGPWSGASAVAVDSSNNIYVASLYGPTAIIAKVPYLGGSTNGGYAAFTTPTSATPVCTATSTTECSVPDVGAIYPSAMSFDAVGDLFWITSSEGVMGGNGIWKCSAACLSGAGSPVQLYQEPVASSAPSTASGQLIAGGLAIDPTGNIFFTDSSTYVNVSSYAYTSFYSHLNELPVSTGVGYGGATTGYAAAPTILYTVTPASVGTYDNLLDAVAVNAKTGTVYFADQSDGTFAFPNSGAPIPVANGQPTALYTVSTQGAKDLAIDGAGNLYLAASSTVINTSGSDTIAQLTIDAVNAPASPVGTAVSPSATLNPVTTILNDGGCSSMPAPSVSFVAGASSTATAAASTTGSCQSTLSGGSAFTSTVSFTPTAGGADSVSLTATDQASNAGTVAVAGVGQVQVMAQTINFSNPGSQLVGTPLTLTATASSGLTVAFTSATSTICTVASTTVTFLIAGTCTISANQAGNSAYSAAAQVQQSFTVAAGPSFTLAPTAAGLSVTAGSSATDTINVTGTNGFTGSVTFALTGLPSGVTAAFATNPATGSSGLTLTAGSAAAPGAATLTVTGTSGTLTASTTIALTVNPAPSFTLAPAAGAVSLTPGGSAMDTVTVTGVNGFTGSVTLAATGLPSGVTASFATNPTTGSSSLTLMASSAAATGAATVTITGASGTLTASTTIGITVTVPASFTIAPTASALSIAQGGSATDTVNITGVNGFSGNVTLAASGLPTGVTTAFATNPATGTSVVSFTASGTAAVGAATVTITGTSGTLAASTTIALTVTPPVSFSVAPSASTISVTPGTNSTDTITVSGSGGFTGAVTLSAAVTSSPQGAQNLPTFSFGSTSPVNVTGTAAATATLTISTTPATQARLTQPADRHFPWQVGGGGALACMLLFVVPARRRKLPMALGLLVCLVTITSLVAGCGGGSSAPTATSGTTPGTYVVTVTATAGGSASTATISVVVQ